MSCDPSGEARLLPFPSSARDAWRRDGGADVGQVADAPVAAGEAQPTEASLARTRERALLDAWREAHWTLRLKLQELSRHLPGFGIEALYDEARRCDNLLNEFYQSRADVLARQLRDLREARSRGPADHARPGSSEPVVADARSRLTIGERALLARVRELSADDRATLLRLAAHLAGSERIPRS